MCACTCAGEEKESSGPEKTHRIAMLFDGDGSPTSLPAVSSHKRDRPRLPASYFAQSQEQWQWDGKQQQPQRSSHYLDQSEQSRALPESAMEPPQMMATQQMNNVIESIQDSMGEYFSYERTQKKFDKSPLIDTTGLCQYIDCNGGVESKSLDWPCVRSLLSGAPLELSALQQHQPQPQPRVFPNITDTGAHLGDMSAISAMAMMEENDMQAMNLARQVVTSASKKDQEDLFSGNGTAVRSLFSFSPSLSLSLSLARSLALSPTPSQTIISFLAHHLCVM